MRIRPPMRAPLVIVIALLSACHADLPLYVPRGLQVTPAELRLTPVFPAKSTTAVLTVRNTGQLLEHVWSSIDAGFTLDPSDFSLAPGASRLVVVQFTPDDIGTYEADAVFRSRGPKAVAHLVGIGLDDGESCPPFTNPCAVRTCHEGQCVETIQPDGTPCGGPYRCATAACVDGICRIQNDTTSDCYHTEQAGKFTCRTIDPMPSGFGRRLWSYSLPGFIIEGEVADEDGNFYLYVLPVASLQADHPVDVATDVSLVSLDPRGDVRYIISEQPWEIFRRPYPILGDLLCESDGGLRELLARRRTDGAVVWRDDLSSLLPAYDQCQTSAVFNNNGFGAIHFNCNHGEALIFVNGATGEILHHEWSEHARAQVADLAGNFYGDLDIYDASNVPAASDLVVSWTQTGEVRWRALIPHAPSLGWDSDLAWGGLISVDLLAIFDGATGTPITWEADGDTDYVAGPDCEPVEYRMPRPTVAVRSRFYGQAGVTKPCGQNAGLLWASALSRWHPFWQSFGDRGRLSALRGGSLLGLAGGVGGNAARVDETSCMGDTRFVCSIPAPDSQGPYGVTSGMKATPSGLMVVRDGHGGFGSNTLEMYDLGGERPAEHGWGTPSGDVQELQAPSP